MSGRQRVGGRMIIALWTLGATVAVGLTVALAEPAAVDAPLRSSNHALIITVSQYLKSPLPGVLNDRKLARELAQRFGIPSANIVELSEQQVTREGLRQALADLDRRVLPGDKLYVYFSGHGARFYSKATSACTESIVMQDMHVVTNTEFAAMLRPISAKADKTVVMLDSCHSGGVASATSSRAMPLVDNPRPKFSAEASSPECALAVNLGAFSQARGVDLSTTDHNLVILAAARPDEVAWDTSKGGALTYNFEQCSAGAALDADHSGSLSMRELTDCVQARLDRTQESAIRQHVTLAGNAAIVPAFGTAAAAVTPAAADPAAPAAAAPAAAAPVDPVALLEDIYHQRDDRWGVDVRMTSSILKIGSTLELSVRSERAGFVYLLYQGTQPGSFYLLFPNRLDSDNAIRADQELRLPRPAWAVTALGPAGTDHVLVLVSATPRDFSNLALPAEYVSDAGPFTKIHASAAAAQRVAAAATSAAAAASSACRSDPATRDLGVAKICSNVYGASLVSVAESD